MRKGPYFPSLLASDSVHFEESNPIELALAVQPSLSLSIESQTPPFYVFYFPHKKLPSKTSPRNSIIFNVKQSNAPSLNPLFVKDSGLAIQIFLQSTSMEEAAVNYP